MGTDVASLTCPACGEALPTADPRRIWCSAKCRRWVHRVGGPAAAASLKRSWADSWEAAVLAYGDKGYTETADALRRETTLLDGVAAR
jgi:hypothetical protein